MSNTKKFFILICLAIVLLIIGALVGWFGASAYFYSNKEGVCDFWQNKPSKETIQEEINKITSLEPDQIIIGKVESIGNNEISLKTYIVNPLIFDNPEEISIQIPINPNDEIIRLKNIPETGEMETIKFSFNDINIDDFLTIKILTDKKIIYLPVLR